MANIISTPLTMKGKLLAIQKEMRELPDLKGSAIILDDNSERLYPVRIRPRLTWHGGSAPSALSSDEDF